MVRAVLASKPERKMSNLTRSEKQVVRAYVLERDGAEKAQVRANGEVHVYGTMPNADSEGWYFAGDAAELLNIARIESENQ